MLGVVQLPSGDILMAVRLMRGSDSGSVGFMRSTDGGATWTGPVESIPDIRDRWYYIAFGNFGLITGADLQVAPAGTVWFVLSQRRRDERINTYDIYYWTSTDEGETWSETAKFTEYAGQDSDPAITFVDGEPLVAFDSGRSPVEYPLFP